MPDADESSRAPSPSPSAEIAALDPDRHCERIVFLLTAQLFPWDVERSLELALLRTYGIPSISRLLAGTGELVTRTRKRYDDTELLLAEIGEHGLDSARGRQALSRINAMHARFKISNDDFLYVLSTFVFEPIAWIAAYGRRPFTPHEQRAWLRYYQELGRRMGIEAVPKTLEDFRAFRERYEAERLVFAETNRTVAAATIDLVVGMYVPRALIPLARPGALALCDAKLLAAFGYEPPPGWLVALVRGALALRGRILRLFPEPKRLRLITTRRTPTYPGGYSIAELGVLPPGG